MSIEQDFVGVISDPRIHQISFNIYGRTVRGMDMPQVVAAIGRRQWLVTQDSSARAGYVLPDQRLIALTYHPVLDASFIYEAIHEATHAMLVITGVDRPGLDMQVEVISTLLPVIYFFIARPHEAESGQLWGEGYSVREFVNFVRDRQMWDSSTYVVGPYDRDDLRVLQHHVRNAQRQQAVRRHRAHGSDE